VVFRKHFKNLYERAPVYDQEVVKLLRNEPIVYGLDHLPTNNEILKATRGMKNKAPGESGLTPQMFKASLTDNQTFELHKTVILDFWESELAPEQWETGMLKILPKKGDLSRPPNLQRDNAARSCV